MREFDAPGYKNHSSANQKVFAGAGHRHQSSQKLTLALSPFPGGSCRQIVASE
jgi:hypothetical protein